MRGYRWSVARLTVLAVALAVASTAAAATPPRVLKLGWHEYKSLPSDGAHAKGELDFTVSRVTVTRSRWTVAATIRNRSDYAIHVILHDVGRTPLPPSRCCGLMGWMGIDAGTRLFRLYPATRYAPSMPAALKPHATWTGTFSGTSPLPRKTDLRVSFGVFRIESLTWGPPVLNGNYSNEYFTWVTDHVFRL